MPPIETTFTPFDFALTIFNSGINIITLITMIILIRILYRIGNQREKFFDAFLRNPTPQNPGYQALAASMESIDARLQVLANQLTVHSNTMGVSFNNAKYSQQEAFDLATAGRKTDYDNTQRSQKAGFDAARDADHTLTNPPLAVYDARAQKEREEAEAAKPYG